MYETVKSDFQKTLEVNIENNDPELFIQNLYNEYLCPENDFPENNNDITLSNIYADSQVAFVDFFACHIAEISRLEDVQLRKAEFTNKKGLKPIKLVTNYITKNINELICDRGELKDSIKNKFKKHEDFIKESFNNNLNDENNINQYLANLDFIIIHFIRKFNVEDREVYLKVYLQPFFIYDLREYKGLIFPTTEQLEGCEFQIDVFKVFVEINAEINSKDIYENLFLKYLLDENSQDFFGHDTYFEAIKTLSDNLEDQDSLYRFYVEYIGQYYNLNNFNKNKIIIKNLNYISIETLYKSIIEFKNDRITQIENYAVENENALFKQNRIVKSKAELAHKIGLLMFFLIDSGTKSNLRDLHLFFIEFSTAKDLYNFCYPNGVDIGYYNKLPQIYKDKANAFINGKVIDLEQGDEQVAAHLPHQQNQINDEDDHDINEAIRQSLVPQQANIAQQNDQVLNDNQNDQVLNDNQNDQVLNDNQNDQVPNVNQNDQVPNVNQNDQVPVKNAGKDNLLSNYQYYSVNLANALIIGSAIYMLNYDCPKLLLLASAISAFAGITAKSQDQLTLSTIASFSALSCFSPQIGMAGAAATIIYGIVSR